MKAAILSCGNLVPYVVAALKKYQLTMPIVSLDMNLHVEPKKMRQAAIDAFANRIPQNCDTILVAQGYCGGVWENVKAPKKMVFPRVDDCVSIALATDDKYIPNRKKMRHFYDFNILSGLFSPQKLYRSMVKQYGESRTKDLFELWFKDYHALDVVDTGLEDLNTPEMTEKIEKSARLIGAKAHRVPGSNRILEKLVTGRWDEQFVVKQPYETISMADFIDVNWQSFEESYIAKSQSNDELQDKAGNER